MREIDTETSVVWPAWCYSGETVNEDLPQTAISPSLQQQSSNQSQLNSKNRGKRKTPTTIIQPIRPLSSGAVNNNNNNDSNINNNNNNNNNSNSNSHQTTLQSLDKMLSERIYDRKKYLNSPNNMSSFYDKLRNGDSDNQAANLISNLVNNSNSASLNNKNISDLSVMNNNNGSINNNSQNSNSNANNNNSGSSNNSSATSIKSERFSPNSHDVQSTASRSRSVTPSSFSGTPPQTLNSNEMFPGGVPAALLLPSPNANPNRTEFQARNCSDIMRSLAAKYNNNNNDQTSIKNSFLEPKMRVSQPKSFIDSPLSKRPNPIAPTQVPNSNSIMSSLFPGLPFQSAVFPPLIDMTSTQALVALARAAKESELSNMLKNDSSKKTNSRNSSPPLQNNFQSPFPPNYLPGLLPAFQMQTSPSSSSSSALKSPSRPTENPTTPLDLSSTPPVSKRMKLSPNPGKTTPSPSPSLLTSNQPQQHNEAIDQKPTARKCHALSDELNAWTVDNVCDFVGSIDICAEYVQNFRDQSIDGTGLPLLTEEHLTNSLGMKLGPALKLRSLLAKKLGGPCPCASCSQTIKAEMANTGMARPPSIEPGS